MRPKTLTPKISILLPVYNGARFIENAIASVQAQSFIDWELLVVDDGSTDDTAAIVRRLGASDRRLRLEINDTNLGIQKTLNRGLALSRGNYVARIDDDDEWCDPEKLLLQYTFLKSNPDHALVGTGAIVISEESHELVRYLLPADDSSIRDRMLFKNCFIHSSVFFLRSAVVSLGGYDENGSSRHVEDYDLWLRLGQTLKFANLPRHSVRLRVRSNGISSRNRIDQVRKCYLLARKYRTFYPRAGFGILFGMLRLVSFRFFLMLPIEWRNTIFRFYKQQ